MGKKKATPAADPPPAAPELNRPNTFEEASEGPTIPSGLNGLSSVHDMATPYHNDIQSYIHSPRLAPASAPARATRIIQKSSRRYVQDGLGRIVGAGSAMANRFERSTPFASGIRRRLEPYTSSANLELSRAAERVDSSMVGPIMDKFETKGTGAAVTLAFYSAVTFVSGLVWGLLPRQLSETEYTLDLTSGMWTTKKTGAVIGPSEGVSLPNQNRITSPDTDASNLDILKRGVDKMFYSPFSVFESVINLVSRPPAASAEVSLEVRPEVRSEVRPEVRPDVQICEVAETSSGGADITETETVVLMADETHYCKNLGWDFGNWIKERVKHTYFAAVESCYGPFVKSWPGGLKMPEANMTDLGDWFARQLPPSIISNLTKLAESIRSERAK